MFLSIVQYLHLCDGQYSLYTEFSDKTVKPYAWSMKQISLRVMVVFTLITAFTCNKYIKCLKPLFIPQHKYIGAHDEGK